MWWWKFIFILLFLKQGKEEEKPYYPPDYSILGEYKESNFKKSLSFGYVTDGYLLNSKKLPINGKYYNTCRSMKKRGTNHGTEELINGLLDVAKKLNQKFKDTKLMICNISVKGGGPIKFSASHQAGRDVDIGYIIKDETGKTVNLNHFVTFRWTGKSRGWHGKYRFDVEKNWELVKLFLTSKFFKVQYMFMYYPLKEKLLKYAEKIGEPEELLKKADLILQQPGKKEHRDHIHVRILCSEKDYLLGCRDFGSAWSFYESNFQKSKEKLTKALNLLHSEEEEKIKKGINLFVKVNRFKTNEYGYEVLRFLKHKDESIRKLVLKNLRFFYSTQFTDYLIRILKNTPHKDVVFGIIQSTKWFIDKKWQRIFRKIIRKGDKFLKVKLAPEETLKLKKLAISGLSYVYDPASVYLLIKLTKSKTLVKDAVSSLKKLVFYEIPVPRKKDRKELKKYYKKWLKWWQRHNTKSRYYFFRKFLKKQGYKLYGRMLRWRNLPVLFQWFLKNPQNSQFVQTVFSNITGKKVYVPPAHPEWNWFFWIRVCETTKSIVKYHIKKYQEKHYMPDLWKHDFCHVENWENFSLNQKQKPEKTKFKMIPR